MGIPEAKKGNRESEPNKKAYDGCRVPCIAMTAPLHSKQNHQDGWYEYKKSGEIEVCEFLLGRYFGKRTRGDVEEE